MLFITYHICTSIGLVSKNKLKLNTSKTKDIVYHRPRLSRHIIPPPLPDIEQVTSAKISCVIFSHILSPTPHISAFLTQCNQRLYLSQLKYQNLSSQVAKR